MKRLQYSLITQKIISEAQTKDEISFFSDFHRVLLASVDTVIGENKKNIDEMIAKSISGLRGVLSPYLSTPLTSDKSDIDRALKDNFQFMMEQFCALSNNSTPTIATYKVLELSHIPLHRQSLGVIRRILKNGKNHLADTGITYGKNAGQVYCTIIDFSDYTLLAAMHSTAKEYSIESVSTEYRIINDFVGEIIVRTTEANYTTPHTIVLQWDGTDSLLTSVRDRMKAVSERFDIPDIFLVKKSFFGGFGGTYQLHFTADLHKHALGSIILSIVGDDDELKGSIITQGSLLVLEKLM